MAGDDVIAFLSAAALTELYRKRELSPVEPVDLLFGRLDRLQSKLNGFCIVDRDGARAAARASEERWRQGEPLGPLDGVPVTIKDLMLMRGFPTLRGSHLVNPDQEWAEDTPAVARLREAGAVILGKTTTSEFGWKALGDSPLHGITRNPWDTSRSSGGSSAGAAVAAAAGIGVLHLGSDGAGSIRTPSSFCGVFGLKPSFGRVAAYPPSPLGLLSHHGPIARAVADAALMLRVIAQPDHRDPYALPADDRDWHSAIEGGIKGWHVAFSPDLGYARVDPEVAAAVTAGAREFERLGAVVEEVGEIFASPRDALFTLWASGLAALLRTFPGEEKGLVDAGLLQTAAAGERMSAADWIEADLVRTALGRQMGAFHQHHDLLLTPTMPIPALPAGQDLNDAALERHWIDWSPFSYPFNMTRQPAASICCGLTKSGLPIGLQIVGPPYRDDRVLRAARAFEETQPFRHPPLLEI